MMTDYYISIRTARVQNMGNKKLLPKIWNNKNSHSLLKRKKNGIEGLRTVWLLLTKLNTVLTYNSEIVHPNEL